MILVIYYKFLKPLEDSDYDWVEIISWVGIVIFTIVFFATFAVNMPIRQSYLATKEKLVLRQELYIKTINEIGPNNKILQNKMIQTTLNTEYDSLLTEIRSFNTLMKYRQTNYKVIFWTALSRAKVCDIPEIPLLIIPTPTPTP